MKADKLFYKRMFWILFIISIIGILTIGIDAIKTKSEYEKFKIGSVELMRIMIDAQTACIDYANLTNEEFQNVFFEWGVEQIRTKPSEDEE